MKFAVLVLAVPFLMLQWGYSWPDIREWYRQLFFGLRIGNTEVTIGALLASIIVFGLGYAAARLFQGWLDAQVLQPAGISGGVRNSIRTGVGYVGIIIAAVVAFSYAGFNLSSLAIVAGALSVGIGFGLQNLVNNFVSGIILLAERPIRVGDLVLAGRRTRLCAQDQRPLDRNRNVRRRQRSHSQLVFHLGKGEELDLPQQRLPHHISIGVAYGSDPRQVQAPPAGVAQKHAEVLTTPAPAVTLDDFGAANISFTLYAFMADVEQGRLNPHRSRHCDPGRFRRGGHCDSFGAKRNHHSQSRSAARNDRRLRNVTARKRPPMAAVSHPPTAQSRPPNDTPGSRHADRPAKD